MKIMKPKRRKPKELVRSELNLEQNSIFTVSTYRKKSREIVVRETSPTGEITERKVIIGKTAQGFETGVLTTNHFRVYLVLLELWEKAGRPIHDPVHFTILKIIKRLGLTDDGRTYAEIKGWLRDLREIPLTFTQSFYIPKQEEYVDLHDVTILNHLYIYERKKVGKQKKTRGYGEFRFDDYILESLIANHTHPLRLDVIKDFKKHKDLAILLYTYLDRNLALRDKYEIGLEKLFEHLDLSQRYVRYPAERKRVIEPVLKQLEGKPLSTGILSYCRIHKTRDGKDYKLIARKKVFEVLAEPQEEPQLPRAELITILTEEGLTESQARELVEGRDEATIRLQLEALPYRVKKYKDRGGKPNRAAILYSSIKENWPAPREYWEAKEREEREKRARYYNLYSCTNMECEYFHTLLMVPREKPQPKRCPRCGSSLELEHKDWKEFK